MPNWNKIKAEYVRGGTSYNKLAKKYGVSFSTLRKIASKEKWTDLRSKCGTKRDIKIVESVASQESKRVDGLLAIADMLQEKIAEGISDGRFITDAQTVRQIVSALKDLRDIKGCKSELDMQEQIARIDKLRKDASSEAQKDIRVVISNELDDYSV